MVFAIASAPDMTCMGMVSATVNNSLLALKMQQEQSCPLAMTPERDERTKVCCIVLAILSNRRDRIAKVTGSIMQRNSQVLDLPRARRIEDCAQHRFVQTTWIRRCTNVGQCCARDRRCIELLNVEPRK